MPDSLQLHGLWNARLICPPSSPGICSDLCQLSWWCYLTITYSAATFSFCFQSFPASEYFPMNWVFAVSQNQDVFPWVGSLQQVAKEMEIQLQQQSFQWIFRVDFLSDWFTWSLSSPRLSRDFSSPTVWKHQFFGAQSLWFYLISIHDYCQNNSFDSMDLCHQNDVSVS